MKKYHIIVDLEKCQAPAGCDLTCIKTCPLKVLAYYPKDTTREDSPVVIMATFPFSCNGCELCVEVCKPKAISVSPPT
ncbi:MAG: ferredoxin [Candidatus Lokiarchaeia archaeon]